MTPLPKVAIVGLGYVGLPLAVCFAKRFEVVGFDINRSRIDELKAGHDRTKEISSERLRNNSLSLTCNAEGLRVADVIVIAVPTPIDEFKRPDLRPLLGASRTVGKYMSHGTTIIYESTVYPGATEEDCIPVLETESGLKWKRDFNVGYSPERINPGDKKHTIEKIVKVVSGDTPGTADFIERLYSEVIPAGIFKAASIKTAEAAKVIENCQRDINIAFVNELALIFQRLGIDTGDVLEAAGSKWNFLPFRPGLVGGHCIGVDPYYLTHKAESIGYHPQVILSGRRINDGMGQHVARRMVKLLIEKGRQVGGARVIILGITFKENCPDIRNSKVIEIVRELWEFGVNVSVFDPLADRDEVRKEFGIELLEEEQLAVFQNECDAVIHAVAHDEFANFNLSKWGEGDVILYDLKSVLPRALVDERL